MAINHRVFLEENDTNDRQHRAMGVLPHPSHTPMTLDKLWVANTSLASTSATHFATRAQGLITNVA